MLKPRVVAFGFTVLVLSLLLAAPAWAAKSTTTCRLDFTLQEWAVGVKVGHGSGTVTCENGQTAQVKLEAKGVGIAAGKSVVRDGQGKFSDVANIDEVFGRYVAAGVAAGAGKSAQAQALTKGPVGLTLTGKGNGVELGVTLEAVTISKEK
jgi:hypothetical protein